MTKDPSASYRLTQTLDQPTYRPNRADPSEPVVDIDAGMSLADNLLPLDLLDGGEIILLLTKPSPWIIILQSLTSLFVIGVITLLLIIAHRTVGTGSLSHDDIVKLGVVLTIARLAWAFFEWLGRVFVLTNRRTIWITGVFQASVSQIPLNQLAKVELSITRIELLFGLGTIVFTTKGTESTAEWPLLRHPAEIHGRILNAIHGSR